MCIHVIVYIINILNNVLNVSILLQIWLSIKVINKVTYNFLQYIITLSKWTRNLLEEVISSLDLEPTLGELLTLKTWLGLRGQVSLLNQTQLVWTQGWVWKV